MKRYTTVAVAGAIALMSSAASAENTLRGNWEATRFLEEVSSQAWTFGHKSTNSYFDADVHKILTGKQKNQAVGQSFPGTHSDYIVWAHCPNFTPSCKPIG